jgi:purine-nucleoside/S-methyl-5'-thioadenosine phosphorylase / adenosine deaminase
MKLLADLPPPFRREGDHIAIDLPGARALFTTRRGGVSEGPFASLNLGLWTEDDPDRVSANRDRLAGLVGIPRERFAQGRQVHGATVNRLREPPDPGTEPPPSDGQATDLPGVAPVVLVADCLPIAVAGEGAVAMLHAGWRGLAAGVIEEGLAALRALRAEPVEAAIGPGVGPCCYRVGLEVAEEFAGEPVAVEQERDGFRLELGAVARRRLHEAGVGAVHDVGLCTHCSDPSLFFSHRRERGVTGRQAGVIRRLEAR